MTAGSINVRPAADALVRHEDGRALAIGGETVVDTAYWRRRIADGDATLTPTPKKRSTKR